MTIKNNFAILNNNVASAHCVNNSEKDTQGGKTTLLYNFLTLIKFNFDSLSRKIKNPCLVIKILSIRRNSMKNSKKLFLIILSVLTVAFISCNKVTAIPTFKVSDIAGGWTGTNVAFVVAFVIDNDGNLTYNSKTYQIPEADWNSEKTEYTIDGTNVEMSGASITFTSATSGTVKSASETVEIDISKVQ